MSVQTIENPSVQADINVQFDQIMAANFADQQTLSGNEAYLDAMMQQNLRFEDLSADNQVTADAMRTPEGLSAIMAPSLALEGLAAATLSQQAAAQTRQNEMLYAWANNKSDDKE